MSSTFRPPVRRVSLPIRLGDGRSEVREAEYLPHELEAMRDLRRRVEVATDPAEARRLANEAQVLHELKVFFPDGEFEVAGSPEREPEFVQSSLEEAAAARDEAMRRVDRAADPDWKDEALAAVRRTCEALEEFISDDVWEHDLPGTREDRALGLVIRRAKDLGWCEKTGRMRPSVRSHLSEKPVWRSLIYAGEASC